VGEFRVHARLTLVRESADSEGEPGMIIQDRKRVTATPRDEREVTLIVHLPQGIGEGCLEPSRWLSPVFPCAVAKGRRLSQREHRKEPAAR